VRIREKLNGLKELAFNAESVLVHRIDIEQKLPGKGAGGRCEVRIGRSTLVKKIEHFATTVFEKMTKERETRLMVHSEEGLNHCAGTENGCRRSC
jgi:hypothetical protein